MKKLFFTLMSLILLSSFNYAQQSCATNNLNISTGQNGLGGQVSSGTADPFWTSTSTGANNTAVTTPWAAQPNWNSISGAMVLNFSTNQGTFVFKRCFYLCEQGTIKINGNWRCDNLLTSIKIVSCNNPQQVFWTYTQPAGTVTDPQCWKDVLISGSTSLSAGAYALEFTYQNTSGRGGFAVNCNLTASANILANSAECCQKPSCCNNIEQYKISGTSSINCSQPVTFRIDSCKDVTSYNWSFSPSIPAYQIVGQGTSTVTVNPSIAPGNYTVTLVIKCNQKQYTKTYNFTVTGIQNCRPNFLVSTNEINATNYSVTAVPSLSTAGISHYFVIYNTNTCGGTIGSQVGTISYKPNGSIAYSSLGVTTAGASNNGISYKNLVKGQCYVVRHYVLCCGQWVCLQKCVCMGKDGSCKNPPKDFDSYDMIEKEIMIDAKELPEEIKKLEAAEATKGRG